MLCIEEIRKAQSVSQQAVADVVGTYRSQFAKVERGAMPVKTIGQAAIAKALDFPVAELFLSVSERTAIATIRNAVRDGRP